MVISVPHTCLFFFFFHSSFLPSSALRRTGGRDWFHGIPDKVIKDHAPVCTRRTGFSDQLLRFFFVRERERKEFFRRPCRAGVRQSYDDSCDKSVGTLSQWNVMEFDGNLDIRRV